MSEEPSPSLISAGLEQLSVIRVRVPSLLRSLPEVTMHTLNSPVYYKTMSQVLQIYLCFPIFCPHPHFLHIYIHTQIQTHIDCFSGKPEECSLPLLSFKCDLQILFYELTLVQIRLQFRNGLAILFLLPPIWYLDFLCCGKVVSCSW